MRLREFFALLREEDADQPSNGVPRYADDEGGKTTPFKRPLAPDVFSPSGDNRETQPYRQQFGAGSLSNGVPEPSFHPDVKFNRAKTDPLINWKPPEGAQTKNPGPSPKRPVASPTTDTGQDRFKGSPDSPTRVIPQSAPPEAKAAVHPWGESRPENIPQPIEPEPTEHGSYANVNPTKKEEGLVRFFALDEMARTKGSWDNALHKALAWARQQNAPFTSTQLYRVFRAAGGGGQMDDLNGQRSFDAKLKRISVQPNERPTEYQPLVMVQRGTRGGKIKNPSVYTYGRLRPGQSTSTAAAGNDRLAAIKARAGQSQTQTVPKQPTPKAPEGKPEDDGIPLPDLGKHGLDPDEVDKFLGANDVSARAQRSGWGGSTEDDFSDLDQPLEQPGGGGGQSVSPPSEDELADLDEPLAEPEEDEEEDEEPEQETEEGWLPAADSEGSGVEQSMNLLSHVAKDTRGKLLNSDNPIWGRMKELAMEDTPGPTARVQLNNQTQHGYEEHKKKVLQYIYQRLGKLDAWFANP